MVSYIISRLVVLMFGTLYPAYSSYKAVKTRNVKEYVKWMMYWIVFALFTCVETIADIFASILPFYYEAKILFIFWLISPWTKGATYLYRKFVHPTLTKREQEIDDYLAQASDKGLKAIKKVGQNGLTIAANAVMQSAMKTTLIDQLRNYSTYYNTSPVKQLEGVPEEAAEEVEEAREAKEHMALLRSEDTTDTEEDEDSPHYRNKQLKQSLESLDNRLREERDERDNDLSYNEELYEHERLERLEREREQMDWEQEQQERLDQQEIYKNRRLLQSTHDLPPQPPRHRKTNPSKRERNFTTSLTREEFDNANNMYAPATDDEISFKRSSSLRRPYSSTENLSRKPVRKHEPLVRTYSERSSSRPTRSSSRLTQQKPASGIQITRY
ncbi:uncharacterized protein [Amphiura filiformis]|uniref:uncharacterized protein isoform X2 n=1 Tax=Amphiura filiformis TaxID=82378 RepID=UPI003B21ADD8